MKLLFTKEQIVARLKILDTRAKKLSDEQVDLILDRAYGQMTSMYGQAFADEEVVDLTPYYESGELNLTLDVEEDVIDVYSLYVTEEPIDGYLHNIKKEFDEHIVYRDNRYSGRVHLDLNGTYATEQTTDSEGNVIPAVGRYSNCIIKYMYTPTSQDGNIYVDSITMTAFEFAIAASLFSYFKDDKAMDGALANLNRVAGSITMPAEDDESQYRNITY